MIHAHHCIFTAYGFWPPNDPRGSWSDFVWAWELFKFGVSTKTDMRRSVANRAHDRDLRKAAKDALRYPEVKFTGLQARATARGFAKARHESKYRVIACSIMPDHVHVVCERHERPVEKIVGHLKARATQQLIAENLHPLANLLQKDDRFPTVWRKASGKVFLDADEDIVRAVDYANKNPTKQGMKPQTWRFIAPRPI